MCTRIMTGLALFVGYFAGTPEAASAAFTSPTSVQAFPGGVSGLVPCPEVMWVQEHPTVVVSPSNIELRADTFCQAIDRRVQATLDRIQEHPGQERTLLADCLEQMDGCLQDLDYERWRNGWLKDGGPDAATARAFETADTRMGAVRDQVEALRRRLDYLNGAGGFQELPEPI